MALLLLGVAWGAAAEVSIRSDYMMVACDTNTGRVSISRATGEPLLSDVLVGDGTAVSVAEGVVTNKAFKVGKALHITHANGCRSTFAVFQGAPFALFRPTLRNLGQELLATNKVMALSGAVAYWRGQTEVKTFGTGGLLAPEKNPGSYAWMSIVEPESRTGLVLGWLTHDRGSGVFFTPTTGGVTTVTARLDYGQLRERPGQEEELESLVVGHFSDARLGLEQWADMVARQYDIHLPPEPTGYCTWYSRPHGGASDEVHIEELARFVRTNLAPYGFSVVQIDDGWQAGKSTNGPKRDFATHSTKGPYKSGMKAAADAIRGQGLIPGLWFMPFAGTYYDASFADHQDWFVKRRSDGTPYETAWGGTCLDMTHPGARGHLSNVVTRIARDWGFGYIKIDGLWTGTGTKQQYVNSGYREDNMGDALFFDPAKTNIEAYRDGLKLLRSCAGANVFVLGCNGPQNMRSYAGAIGLVDGMRVGPDNGANWNNLTRGPVFGSRHYFLNGRVWWNDPDPVYARADMPLNHAQLICSWVALSGQMNLSSEWLPGLPPERLEILKRTMPPHGKRARPVDLFENDPPRIWHIGDGDRNVIGLFNWGDEEVTMHHALDRIGMNPFQEFDVFDYWSNTLLPSIKGEFRISVPAQSCRALAVRARSLQPKIISTSRHVSQGMVDVLEERWDSNTRTLRGRSRVIGGDSYELRISTSLHPRAIRVQSPITGNFLKEDHLVRATIRSPETRDVSWEIQFD